MKIICTHNGQLNKKGNPKGPRYIATFNQYEHDAWVEDSIYEPTGTKINNRITYDFKCPRCHTSVSLRDEKLQRILDRLAAAGVTEIDLPMIQTIITRRLV